MLAPLQKLVTALRDDLRDCLDGKTDEPADRKAQLAEARQRVQAEYDATKKAERTAQAFPAWREDYLTQVAVAWVLACVFVRYLEDNEFVADCWLGGPDDHRRQEAQARHGGFFRPILTETMSHDEREAERQRAGRLTDRDYLLAVFRRTAAIPAAADLFAEGKTPLWVVGPSADAATKLVGFWHARDAEGDIPTFAAADGDTRFLGDLYQDLSEDVRKKYALLQTPEFVEEFILDRTLDPACKEFGFQHVRLIDPTCGSGHFLLGAFDRLMRLWQHHYQELTGREWNANDAAGRVLGDGDKYPGQVFGADVNPYAVAIARFRLLIAACKWCGVVRLKDAPGWKPQVFCGDSLYHGRRWPVCSNKPKEQQMTFGDWDRLYHFEDVDDVRRVLSQKYHAVVGNPPYITVKDAALNQRYRERYGTCHRQYSLGVPFTERFWDLCRATDDTGPAGYVGMITTNSFMKREFGSKLIEAFFPAIDLTHVIDTSGTYIPGHGTPTVILFGRNQQPQGDAVRAVLGIKGEPATPDDPAKGLVWSSIVENVDVIGTQTAFVSVTDVPRGTFSKHPWSIGGGGAAELREQLDEVGKTTLQEMGASLGFLVITGEDDCFLQPEDFMRRRGLTQFLPVCYGELIRGWVAEKDLCCLWPYTADGQQLPTDQIAAILDFFWPYRLPLKDRKAFSVPVEQRGIPWWGIRELYSQRLKGQFLICFAFVATENSFALERTRTVFIRTSPVIQLLSATEDHYLAVVGALNSSTGAFWLKQVLQSKGGSGINCGIKDEMWEQRYEHDAAKIASFPLIKTDSLRVARQLDALAQQYTAHLPAAVCKHGVPTRADLDAARQKAEAIRRRMVYLQEELDWECYQLYELSAEPLTRPGDPLELRLGERAFEIALARSGEKTAWFDRHRSTPITDLPADWPADYRTLVERRLAEIEANPNVRLIERPEYKRRWASDTWEDMEQRALRSWLLDRLETERYWPRGEPALRSCDQLANEAAADPEFLQVAAVYRGGLVEPAALITELVTAESVPYLPVQRYKESGLRKRAVWEETWALQRREDAGEKLPEPIPVPPKYVSADFLKSDYWRLRGKLDVPKERWVSYPGAERDGDPTPVVTWAGYDHLGQARALAAYYQEAKDQRGWPTEKLIPLLAGLDQLVPWLKQWHNEYSEEFGGRPGDEIDGFVAAAAADLRVSLEAIRGWKPEPTAPKRGRKKS